MYIRTNLHFFHRSKSTVRHYQTFSDAGFLTNQYGHVLNDFARLMRSNDMSALSQRLDTAIEQQSQLGRNDREKIDMLRSRYEQTPAELDRYELFILDRYEDYLKSISDTSTSPVDSNVEPNTSDDEPVSK